MNPEYEQLKQILAEAVSKSSTAERVAYLESACQGDTALRRQVEVLLSAHERAGDFLRQPVVLGEDKLMGEGPGTLIGRYKLLEQIGEGGFGRVFMAEQQEPVQRKVALKIIKAGMDTREVIARFEAERQALAMMDHPNIARVLDAAATDAGRPYFVMELVRGIPITDYCDQCNLPTDQRLRLFMKVCHAVQHAHQKGIIHRDLKPTNILVTLIDGEAVPKIIDFGIAKALGQKLTERTLFTSFNQMVGTPAYMSPEQAALSGVDVDTRSDIYSLGVLLYELLTGAAPLDAETLRKAGLDEVRRIIRETEPPKPSTRLRTLGEKLTEVASRRQTQPSALTRLVHGDLDWIVMKALEKDRSRRYDSASALLQDLEHHLKHEPVKAGPPGTVYRARKFIRRHRVGVAFASILSVTMILGLVAALIGFAQARRERAKATEEAAVAKAITAFLQDDLLGQAYPSEQPDREINLRTIVERASGNVGARFKDKPKVEAAVRRNLFGIYYSLGDYRNARLHLDRVLELCREQGLSPENPRFLDARTREAHLFEQEGHYAESLSIYEDLLSVCRRGFGAENTNTLRTAACMSHALHAAGRYAEAQKLLEETLAACRRKLPEQDRVTFDCMNFLAAAYAQQGRLTNAQALYEEMLSVQHKVQGTNQAFALSTLANLAAIYQQEGKLTEARQMLDEAVPALQRLLGTEHPDALTAQAILADTYKEQGKLAEARRLMDDVLSARRRILGPEHPDTLNALGSMASILSEQNQFALAREFRSQQLAACRRLFGEQHPDTLNALHNLASIESRAGNRVVAQKLFEDVLPRLRQVLGPEHRNTLLAAANVGWLLREEGKLSEAQRVFEETVQLRSKVLGPEHPDTLGTKINLAIVFQKQGKHQEAMQLAKETWTVSQRALGPDHPGTLRIMDQLIWCLNAQGKCVEARPLKADYVAGLQRALGLEHPDTLWGMNNFAWLLATCMDPKGRDGATALDLAQKVVAITGRTNDLFLDSLAAAHAELGQFTEAVSAQQEAIALLASDDGKMKGYEARLRLYEGGLPCREYAPALRQMRLEGRLADLESALREKVAERRFVSGNEDPSVADSLFELATVLMSEERCAEAESAARECLAIRQKSAPKHWRTFSTQSLLGGALLGQKKYAEAEPLLLAGFAGLQQREARIPAADKPHYTNSIQRLELFENTAPPDLAAEMKRNLAELKKSEAGRRLIPDMLRRGREGIEKQSWPEAAQAFREALNTPGFEWPAGEKELSNFSIRMGVAFVRAGDADGHRLLCQKLPTPEIPADHSRRAAYVCLFPTNPEPALLILASNLQSRAEAGFPGHATGRVYQLNRGMLEYRCGRYGAALDQFHLAVHNTNADGYILCQAMAHLFESMAAKRLGRDAEALQLYEQVLSQIPSLAANSATVASNAQYLVYELILDEAEPLLLAGFASWPPPEPGIPHDRLYYTNRMQRLVQFYENTAHPDQGAELKRKLADFQKMETGRDLIHDSLRRGREAVEKQRWPEAAQAFRETLDTPGFEWGPAEEGLPDFLDWMGVAFIRANDVEGHGRLCQKLVTPWMTALAARRAAFVCLLPGHPEPALLVLASNLQFRAEAGVQGHKSWPWYQINRGLMEYRAGQYLSGVEQFSLAAKNTNAHCQATALVLQSMAAKHLGHDAEALVLYQEAISRIPSLAAKSTTLASEAQSLVFHLILDEAKPLFPTEATAPTPPR